jgi:hypothetical protein
MGEVYRAEDMTLDHPVALKFLAACELRDNAAEGQRGGSRSSTTSCASRVRFRTILW